MASKQRPQPLAEELAAMFDGGASSCSSSPAPLTASCLVEGYSIRCPLIARAITSCWISDVRRRQMACTEPVLRSSTVLEALTVWGVYQAAIRFSGPSLTTPVAVTSLRDTATRGSPAVAPGTTRRSPMSLLTSAWVSALLSNHLIVPA